jgi:hypothetical protein
VSMLRCSVVDMAAPSVVVLLSGVACQFKSLLADLGCQ